MKKTSVTFGLLLLFLVVSGAHAMQTLVASSWIMGCDNQSHCTAISYYEAERDAGNSSQTFDQDTVWYVKIDWHQARDEALSLQFYLLDLLPVDINMTLSQLSGMQHHYKLQAGHDEKSEMDFYSITIKPDEFMAQDILTLSYSYENGENSKKISRQDEVGLADFKAFLKDHHLRPDERVKSDAVNAYPWVNKVSIEQPLLKIWLDKYGEPDRDDCYQGESPYAVEDNYIMNIKNFGSLVILCQERGYNGFVTVWQREGDDLIPIEFSPQSLTLLRGDDIIFQNILMGFHADESDHHLFWARFKGRSFGDCGGQYGIVFNGQQFEIVSYEEMPICGYIYHWISLYKRTMNRQ